MATRRPRLKAFGTPLAETERLRREVAAKLEDDRCYWEEVTTALLDEDASPEDVSRIIAIADALTTARRERYPI